MGSHKTEAKEAMQSKGKAVCDLPYGSVQDDVSLQQQWAVNGKHYSRTLEDWLRRQDLQRPEVLPIMRVHLCQICNMNNVQKMIESRSGLC